MMFDEESSENNNKITEKIQDLKISNKQTKSGHKNPHIQKKKQFEKRTDKNKNNYKNKTNKRSETHFSTHNKELNESNENIKSNSSQPSNNLIKTLEILSKTLNLSIINLKTMLSPVLHSTEPESQLYDLLGPEHLQDIEILLKYRDQLLITNTKKSQYYTEILIPPVQILPRPGTKNTSSIFPYSHFNAVQSAVLNVTQSDNSFVLAAPTGSGKTDVATLCILRNVLLYEEEKEKYENHSRSNQKHTKLQDKKTAGNFPQKFNSVYIVPLKALATEITRKLRTKFSCDICATRRRLEEQEIARFEHISGNNWRKGQNDTKSQQFLTNKNALCTQKTKYGYTCHDVQEYTGDTPFTSISGNIIVSTPEKFDAVSRKLSFSYNYSLMIIDEVHMVQEDRGAVVESLVARVRYQNEKNTAENIQDESDFDFSSINSANIDYFYDSSIPNAVQGNKIRIVALSATLPNTCDIGAFINGPVFNFDDTYRAVPMQVQILGGKEELKMSASQLEERRSKYQTQTHIENKNSDHFTANPSENNFKSRDNTQKSKNRNRDFLQTVNNHEEILVEKLSQSTDQTLIFVNSRGACYKTAMVVLKRVLSKRNKRIVSNFENFNQQRDSNSKNTRNSDKLDFLLNNKLGIHHAGMSKKDRTKVESLFLTNKLDYVVCTKTLAWGVNLPAHTVILYGTKYYGTGKMCNVSVTDVLQIVGRAGRIDFVSKGKRSDIKKEDNSNPQRSFGKALIITSTPDLYNRSLKSLLPLDSTLLNSLINILSAQIGLTPMDPSDCYEWMSKTFFYTRALQCPQTYGLLPELDQRCDEIGNYGVKSQNIQNLIALALKKLQKCSLISDTLPHTLTWLGRIASYWYVDYRSVGRMLEFIESDKNQEHSEFYDKSSQDIELLEFSRDLSNKPQKAPKSTKSRDSADETQEQLLFNTSFVTFLNTLAPPQVDFTILKFLLSLIEFDCISVRAEENEFIVLKVSEILSQNSQTTKYNSRLGHIFNRSKRSESNTLIFNPSTISISVQDKLLFLLFYPHVLSLFSLQADKKFVTQTLTRVMSAFEHVLWASERYFDVKTVFITRMSISGINYFENDRKDAAVDDLINNQSKTCRSQSISLKTSENENFYSKSRFINVKCISVNNYNTLEVSISLPFHNTFYLFIYNSQNEIVLIATLNEKETFYLQEESYCIQMFCEGQQHYFEYDMSDLKKTTDPQCLHGNSFTDKAQSNNKNSLDSTEEYIISGNVSSLIPYKMLNRRERLALIKKDTLRILESEIDGKMVIISNEIQMSSVFSDRVSIFKPDEIKKLFQNKNAKKHRNSPKYCSFNEKDCQKYDKIDHLIISGCFSLELMKDLPNLEAKEITILERNDLCEFIDRVLP